MKNDLQRILSSGLALAMGLLPCRPLRADPCGMVWAGGIGMRRPPIVRIGVQNTYVFHRDGIETIVLRPGYQGRAADFGMLIPFPSPPSIRKVPDAIFAHLEAAVTPPEVVVRLPSGPFVLGRQPSTPTTGGPAGPATGGPTVRLLREETVGIYEVAVLEAGSAAALARWMTAHGYRFPTGMDAACDDYAASGWCFVAVKTRLVPKAKVDAKPGARAVGPGPGGRPAAFDGYVQAMAFRFRSAEAVVPMRLSVFNAGTTRNRIYALTDRPVRVAGLSTRMVKRQLAGRRLRHNLTDPLPLRVIGGTEAAIPKAWRDGVAQRRAPVPHNGHALDLFASDLLAVDQDTLLLPAEMEAKRLDSRARDAAHVDPELAELIGQRHRAALDRAIAGLDNMILTVVEGEFPAELLREQNLRFDTFTARRSLRSKSGSVSAFAWMRPRSRSVWLAYAVSSLLIGVYLTCRTRAASSARPER